MRICLEFEDKLYDISNAEFKKAVKKVNQQVEEDRSKVLVEAKANLNNIIKMHNLDFEESKNVNVLCLQVCGKYYLPTIQKVQNKYLTLFVFFLGLRAVIREMWLAAPGAYFVQKYGKTVVYPPNEKKVAEFTSTGLEQLFQFKVIYIYIY